jgi:SOS-response transcriptional repressor LexA
MYAGKFTEADRVIVETIYDKLLKSGKSLKKQAKNNDAQMFETSIFPKEFDKIAQSCYMEQMDAFSKLFEDEQFYKRVMGEMAKAMYLNYRNSALAEEKPVEQQKAVTLYDEYHEGCIPVYTLQAACGYFEDGELPEEEGWADASGNGFTPDPKRHFVIHAKGNSMLPRIKDGDLCVFEWYKAGSREGEIVLTQCSEKDIDYGCKYTIKKYHSEKAVTEEGWQHSKVELIPLNNDFGVIELDEKKEYRTIGVLKCVL